jgi:hypothetical protein
MNKRTENVAFFAGLESNVNGVESDEDARFGNVITNIGNCYDPDTGRFRAPVDGVYQFHIAVAAQGRHKVFNIKLRGDIRYMIYKGRHRYIIYSTEAT